MIDEQNLDVENAEDVTASAELDEQQTEVDEKDTEGVKEPQTPETPASDEPVDVMSSIKKYAKEYGLDEQDFAKIDDPDAFAKRTMEQYKGFLELSRRLEQATQGALPPPLAPQDIPAQVIPSAEDGAVDDLLGDPVGFFNKQMTQRDAKQREQAYKIEWFQQNNAINQWSSTLPPQEVAALLPAYNNDPVIRLKRSMGQIVTIQDAQAAYQHAKMAVGNVQQVRQDALEEGAAATDAKRRAVVETGKKKSGPSTVETLDDLQKRLDAGEELTDKEIRAAAAAEAANG